jgi:hypothetical protein
MALGDAYIQLAELKRYMAPLNNTNDNDTDLQEAIDSSTEEINRICHRDFNDSGNVSARSYQPFWDPDNGPTVITDDFSTTEGLIVACGETVYDIASLTLYPENGLMQGSPWPFTKICGSFTGKVTVTARWGWANVPAPVKQAAYQIAQNVYQLKDQRLGIAGSDQFGQVITVRESGPAMRKLSRYVRDSVLVDS